MKVRINDDATGFGISNIYGKWVEKHRGKEFEVVLKEDSNISYFKEVKKNFCKKI